MSTPVFKPPAGEAVQVPEVVQQAPPEVVQQAPGEVAADAGSPRWVEYQGEWWWWDGTEYHPYQAPEQGMTAPAMAGAKNAKQLCITGMPTSRVVVRDPIIVVVLSVVTLGVYYVYWWYQMNRELADVGRAWQTRELGENPSVSALALFPGVLLFGIPVMVTTYTTVQRLKAAQRLTTGSPTINGWVIVALWLGALVLLVPGLAVPWYFQNELNKVWDSGRAPVESIGLVQAGGPPAAMGPTTRPQP